MSGRGCPCQQGASAVPPLQSGGTAYDGESNFTNNGSDAFPIRSFYPLNSYNQDPNYFQVSERQIPQIGSGVRSKKNKGSRNHKSKKVHMQSGGGALGDITHSFTNGLSNVGSGITNMIGDTGKGLAGVLNAVTNQGNFSTNPVLTQGTILGAGVANNIITGNDTTNVRTTQPLNDLYNANNIPKA